MAIKESTSLCMKQLGGASGDSVQNILNLGFLRIFSGAVPASADAAETGTLLVEITNNDTGTGLTFDDPAISGGNAVLSKAAAETWSGTAVATGVATYYRFVAPGDTGVLSTTEDRIQGTVGSGGTDLVLGNTTITNGALRTIPYFTYAKVPNAT